MSVKYPSFLPDAMLLCCSVKETAKPFVRDKHTETDTGTDSKDSLKAGTDSDSYNRQAGGNGEHTRK